MKKRLLLADDSVTIQKVVQITFSHDDYELTVVDNGDIAYEKARLHRPDLILADVFMPGKNGYELCAAIKNDPSLASVPVLLLTGTFEPFDEAKAQSVGADCWIAKPFESQALIACVEDLLRLAAQAPIVTPSAPLTSSFSVPAPLETIEAVTPDFSADLPDDLWGSDFLAESSVASSQPVEDPFATLNQDDLWDVSGFESDEPVAAVNDPWGESFEPTAAPAPDVSPVVMTASGTDEVDSWEEDDFSTSFTFPADELIAAPNASGDFAEIPLADDIEILEEIDLLEPLDDFPAESTLSQPFAGGDFPFEEESAQPEAISLPPVVAAAPFSAEVLPTTATLSDAQLESIVEQVANVVISRLAGTLLEKIAWEVVPDLAETMIKEELRRIRESVAAA